MNKFNPYINLWCRGCYSYFKEQGTETWRGKETPWNHRCWVAGVPRQGSPSWTHAGDLSVSLSSDHCKVLQQKSTNYSHGQIRPAAWFFLSPSYEYFKVFKRLGKKIKRRRTIQISGSIMKICWVPPQSFIYLSSVAVTYHLGLKTANFSCKEMAKSKLCTLWPFAENMCWLLVYKEKDTVFWN